MATLPPPPPGFTEMPTTLPPPPPGFTEIDAAPPADGVDPRALNYDMPADLLDGTATFVEPAPPETGNPYDSMSDWEAWKHRAAFGIQTMGRGAADVLGSPVDIPVAAFDLGHWLANRADNLVTGAPLKGSPTGDFSMADIIAGLASRGAAAVGAPPLEQSELSNTDKWFQSPIRVATGAALGGAGLARSAPSLASRVEAGAPKRFSDVFLQPYIDSPGLAVARDTATGAGAATGVDLADTLAPDSTVGSVIGALGGAMGGSTVFGTGLHGARFAGKAAKGAFKQAPIGYDPATGTAPTWSETEQAARIAQAYAADPITQAPKAAEAAGTIRRNTDEFREAGLPVPTSGLISDNLGLQDMESTFRTKNAPPFIQRDDELRDAAAKRVQSVRDPGANPDGVRMSIDASERSYEMTRDAEALPLLKQAEESGAAVDATPVLARIDEMLQDEAQDAVAGALNKIRGKLFDAEGNLRASLPALYSVRKEINNIIRGKGSEPNQQFAKKELTEVRIALDAALTDASPEFGEYLQRYREGSAPLDDYRKGTVAATVRGESDMRNVAKRILDRTWGGEADVAALKKLTEGDPEGGRSLRAAFADELARRVTTANRTSAGDAEVSYAALARVFKDEERLLAEVFDQPGQMNMLRQGHRVLEVLRNASRAATAGSNTADKLARATWWEGMRRPFEVAAKARYGILKGGGITRTMDLMMQSLPNNQASVQRVIERAFFDPEIMEYLLTSKVPGMSTGRSNKYVRGLLTAYASSVGGARESALADDVEK